MSSQIPTDKLGQEAKPGHRYSLAEESLIRGYFGNNPVAYEETIAVEHQSALNDPRYWVENLPSEWGPLAVRVAESAQQTVRGAAKTAAESTPQVSANQALIGALMEAGYIA